MLKKMNLCLGHGLGAIRPSSVKVALTKLRRTQVPLATKDKF